MAQILVIDDDTLTLMIIQNALEGEGHTVVSTTDGEAGVEYIKHAQPDLLICDIMLPDWNGLDLMNYVRHLFGGVKLLAVSGGSPEEDWATPESLLESAQFFQKVDGTLKKPFSQDDLLAEVNRILALAG